VTQSLLTLRTNYIPLGSVDFVSGTVVDAKGNELAMGVEIAITHTDGGADDSTHAWLPAEWLGAAAAERECQTTTPVNTATLAGAGGSTGTRYGVYVRLDNGEAQPILQVGWIVLTD
jgi:hypothetical protein